MKYDVTAVAMDRRTRARVGGIRTEEIDTVSNPIFESCRTPLAVERAYESFWNDMNHRSPEIVKVINVSRAEGGRR